jgi:hypothetical protein
VFTCERQKIGFYYIFLASDCRSNKNPSTDGMRHRQLDFYFQLVGGGWKLTSENVNIDTFAIGI